MTAASVGHGYLKPQVVTPRPRQLETPDSYLARLCVVNVIDVDYLRRLTAQRRRHSRRPDELGHVIAELGGPAAGHFRREYARALIHPAPQPNDAFNTSQRTRQACSRCAAGEKVRTYDHRRFMICLKHNRWIGNHAAEQQQVIDHELRTVERRFRRIMAGGLVPPNAHDAVVTAIDRYPPRSMTASGAGSTSMITPRIDRYPARVRILEVLTAYLEQHWPRGHEIGVWHWRPEQARIYEHLRASLTWPVPAASNWKLIDELVQIVVDTIGARVDPFRLKPLN